MKRIVLLGSTGSVGRNVCYLLKRYSGDFRVIGLGAWENVRLLLKQAKVFRPDVVCVKSEKEGEVIKKKLQGVTVLTGIEGLMEMGAIQCDLLFNAISGFNGIYPTIEALERRTKIALANKESLVAGGELAERITGGDFSCIIPVDSEHSTIYRLLKGVERKEVKEVVLTASGGPFFNKKKDLSTVKVEEALTHPRWKMGKKITVDSATLMNKAMEIIEAGWLFGLKPDEIKVVIHPQAVVHSFVRLRDGSMLAHLYNPDMRVPIAYALGMEGNKRIGVKALSLYGSSLSFYKADLKKFPALKLGYKVLLEKGGSGCILNAANEEAVNAFLERRIKFTDIIKVVKEVMRNVKPVSPQKLSDLVNLDREARKEAEKIIRRIETK